MLWYKNWLETKPWIEFVSVICWYAFLIIIVSTAQVPGSQVRSGSRSFSVPMLALLGFLFLADLAYVRSQVFSSIPELERISCVYAIASDKSPRVLLSGRLPLSGSHAHKHNICDPVVWIAARSKPDDI